MAGPAHLVPERQPSRHPGGRACLPRRGVLHPEHRRPHGRVRVTHARHHARDGRRHRAARPPRSRTATASCGSSSDHARPSTAAWCSSARSPRGRSRASGRRSAPPPLAIPRYRGSPGPRDGPVARTPWRRCAEVPRPHPPCRCSCRPPETGTGNVAQGRAGRSAAAHHDTGGRGCPGRVDAGRRRQRGDESGHLAVGTRPQRHPSRLADQPARRRSPRDALGR